MMKSDDEKEFTERIERELRRFNDLMMDSKRLQKMRDHRLEEAVDIGYRIMRLDKVRHRTFGGCPNGIYNNLHNEAERLLKPPEAKHCCCCHCDD
jgi:hypothetical protein